MTQRQQLEEMERVLGIVEARMEMLLHSVNASKIPTKWLRGHLEDVQGLCQKAIDGTLEKTEAKP